MREIAFLALGLAAGILIGLVAGYLLSPPKVLERTVTTTLTEIVQPQLTTTASIQEEKPPFPHIFKIPEEWNGRCIIFVHGLGGDKAVWSKDMEEFMKHGFCVFSFDLPHHGERGHYSPRFFYDVVKEGAMDLLRAEEFLRSEGAEEVYLVSRSLGSIVAGVALGSSGIERAALLLASANLTYVFMNLKPRSEEEAQMIAELLGNPEKLKEIDPLYSLPNYRGRIHFHCGKRDNLLPPETCVMAYESAVSAAERKLVWHDVGHRMPFSEYFDNVLTFFSGKGESSQLLELVEIPDTCGNQICELGEDWRTCPYDCIGKRLLVGFQLHIEEGPGRGLYYNESEELFIEYAETLDRLVRVFEKYGAKLSIQTEKNFAEADVRFGRFILRELRERGHGVGVQSHLGHHMTELGLNTDEEKLRYTRIVRDLVEEALGWRPTNIGGGFELDDVGLLGVCDGCLGFTSMTALEKPYFLSTGKPLNRLHPWILPRTQMIHLETGEWLTHDKRGTIVYIPGWYESKEFEIDCRKNPRCMEAATQSLYEALQDMEEGKINTWYASSHLYQCGREPAEVEYVLKKYEEWLNSLNPLVEKGAIVFLTFDEMTEIYLKWEKARELAEN